MYHIYTYIHYTNVYICICMYVCMYVCMYIYCDQVDICVYNPPGHNLVHHPLPPALGPLNPSSSPQIRALQRPNVCCCWGCPEQHFQAAQEAAPKAVQQHLQVPLPAVGRRHVHEKRFLDGNDWEPAKVFSAHLPCSHYLPHSP